MGASTFLYLYTRNIFGSNVLFLGGGEDKICVVFFYWFIET